MVTGTGVINHERVRFGKGHGFFDSEWGMLYQLGRISAATPSAAVMHDCQVLDETLIPEIFDTVADVILTRAIEVHAPHKLTCGTILDRMDTHMYETIPPLQELKAWHFRTLPVIGGLAWRTISTDPHNISLQPLAAFDPSLFGADLRMDRAACGKSAKRSKQTGKEIIIR